MTTTRLLASLVVPLLFACGAENSGGGGGLVQVPTCDTVGQVLSTDSTGQLVCKPLPAGALTLPSCHKYSEALTSDGHSLSCTARNNESAASTTALNNLETSETLINSYTTRLGKLTVGPAARAVYCGNTPTTTVGRITANNGALVGISAAANLCSQVASCGATGRMCTVYDMYYSVASGVVKQTDTIAKAWVYMAAWQNFSTGAVEPTAGLNDNCGSYTYPTGDRQWQGTAVKWENDNAGDRTLKFYTGVNRTGIGNPSGNYEGAPCNVALPIACCK